MYKLALFSTLLNIALIVQCYVKISILNFKHLAMKLDCYGPHRYCRTRL